MTSLALITGGTSGIGAAFARKLASEGTNLVLAARDEKRLETSAAELSQKYGVTVETIVADLSKDEGVEAVRQRLTAEPEIDMLINNAGFGMHGGFVESPIELHQQMMGVNAVAVLQLMHAALTTMIPKDKGDIINISSVAGFTPGLRPSGTYAATKAFVTALTEGLAGTVEGSGVHVSALCPGWVRSEFHERAGINMKKLPNFMWLEADEVVSKALLDHRRGKVICIPGAQYKLIVGLTRIVPRSVVRGFSKIVGRRSRH